MKKEKGLSESFITGVIALVFLIVGYQTALFVHRAAVTSIAAQTVHDEISYTQQQEMPPPQPAVPPKDNQRIEAIRSRTVQRKVESFRFNPNTVSVEELCRLGFSQKQAQSIDNYRAKGGRFRRKEDFRKSYVVSDSIFRRLEPYIDIPLVDLNLADSVAFDALPGIGGWFASKMVEYRDELGGYSYKEQLMDIYRFDQEKFDALEDLITVSAAHVTPFPLWLLPADSLCRHPYIDNYETARSIVLFRDNNPQESWTVDALEKAGVISSDVARKLVRCVLK